MTDGQIKPQRSGNISEWNYTRNADPVFYVCPNQNMFCECPYEKSNDPKVNAKRIVRFYMAL